MDESVNKTSPKDDEVHFLDYLIAVAKHIRMIIYGSAIVTVVTYLILLILPNTYTSTARLLPPQQNMTLSGQIIDSLGITSVSGASGANSLAGMAASLMGLKTPGDIYVGILKSEPIFDRIIERFKLRQYYSSSRLPSEVYIEDIRKQLGKNANISAGTDGLILIEVTDEDPRRAAEIANGFTAELDNLLQEMARKEANNYLAFIEKELAQTSDNLAKAEEVLRCFSEQTNVLQMDAQTKGMLEYSANLRATIDAKEVQIEVLRQHSSPSSYDVLLQETELKGLKEKLRETEFKSNQNSAGDVCIPTSKVPTLGLEYFRKVREAKYQEVIYQMYAKLMELARLDAARHIPMIQSVGQAIPAEKRSNKRLLLSILVGFCTGFVMIFWAFVLEWKQHLQSNENENQRLALLRTLLDEFLQPYKRGFTRLKNLLRFRKSF
jgi:tyrosine-protein kinase Etk/Wzc